YTGTTTTEGVLLIEDKPIVIKISKVDINSKEELDGAELRIVDKNGKDVVPGWTSDKKKPHEVEVKNFKPGEVYTLVETTAPHGYEVAEKTTFTVDETGKVTYTGTTTTEGVLLVEDKPTSISVSKVDIANGAELEGALIQIIDSNGKVFEQWVSAKQPHVITGLTTGEVYTLREVVAPKGYKVTTDTKFVLNADGTVDAGRSTVVMNAAGVILIRDEADGNGGGGGGGGNNPGGGGDKPNNPDKKTVKTGDENNMMLFAIMGMISVAVAGFGGVELLRRRKKSK
ncbi:MAG: hypothetical protein HUJ76_11730, partial [Parasporobacterium sp.]|nr:hypothetical protein [Parasporobacterium sp.]